MTGKIKVSELSSYTDIGTTALDIALVTGNRVELTEAEAGEILEKLNHINAHRTVLRNLGRLILMNKDAPHNKNPSEDIGHYAYIGERNGNTLLLKAITVAKRPINAYDTAIPASVIADRGFIVYHLERMSVIGKPDSWLCMIHDGTTPLYGDFYGSAAIFRIEIPG